MTEFFAEFGLRDWLLVLGPVFIVGILAHGYWRMRVNRNSLKMALDKSFVSDINDGDAEGDELTLLRAELPNGGARVRNLTEQTSLNLTEDVPVLMDPVDEPISTQASTQTSGLARSEPTGVEVSAENQEISQGDSHVSEAHDKAPDRVPDEVTASAKLPANLPEKYVVINVMSVGQPFQGQALLETLLELNLSLGEMNIFHRHRGEQTVFSLMNAVEPGSFDMATMNEVETPAISMFMRVHELTDPINVFGQMMSVAEAIAHKLGGEVRDDTRSVMTTQTIEHCRQELEDYVFKNHP